MRPSGVRGDGRRLVLVGPSGSGKSLPLRLLAGLERPVERIEHLRIACLDHCGSRRVLAPDPFAGLLGDDPFGLAPALSATTAGSPRELAESGAVPDWAVLDINTPPNSRWPGKVVDAGFFGERWEVVERK